MEWLALLLMLAVVIVLLRWTFNGRGRERTRPLTPPERVELIEPIRSRIEVLLQGGERGQAVRLVRDRTGLSLRLALAEVEQVRAEG